MGSRLCALVANDARFELVAAIDRADPEPVQTDALALDAIIDFSSDAGAREAAALARRHRAALLVGTTGLSDETKQIVMALADTAAVMIAPNTSLGVAVMSHLVAEAARLLGSRYDIDVIETHHAMKKDAPSGTALRLVKALEEKGGRAIASDRVHVLRAGDVIGEHTVQFAGPGEKISITHSATSRDLFVLGALDAAAWLARQKPGRYVVEQAMGLG